MAAQLTHLTSDLVNRRYPDVEFIVTQEAVEKFFKCLSYPYAPEAEIPYSFYASIREGEFIVFNDLGVELRQLLHVSQNYTYHSHLKIGDKITSKVSINKVNSRKLGGSLVVFIELHNKYYRNNELVAEADGNVIVREAT